MLHGFTDEEADLLTSLSAPLPPSERRAFLKIVADKLAPFPDGARGPGLVHRLAVETQQHLLKFGPVAVGVRKHEQTKRRERSLRPRNGRYIP